MNPADMFDKASILQIKMQRLGVDLSEDLARCIMLTKHFHQAPAFIEELRRLNEMGWETNDQLFQALQEPYPSTFGEALRLIVYAKLSHAINQARITLKNDINRQLGCAEQEIKSWQPEPKNGSNIRASEKPANA